MGPGPLLAGVADATGATWLDVLDAAWLVAAGRRPAPPVVEAPPPQADEPPATPSGAPLPEEEQPPPSPDPPPRPAARLGLRAPGTAPGGRTVAVPGPPPLTEGRAWVRALRPLRQRVPSRRLFDLDEAGTVQRIADLDLWEPVLRPRGEPGADLAIVVDQGGAWPVLRGRIRALVSLLEGLGAFRTVRRYTLDPMQPGLLRGGLPGAARGAPVAARRLADPTGRLRVLVVSDLTAPAWWDGRAARMLAGWPRPAIVHPLDPGLWTRTGLGRALSPAALSDLRAWGEAVPVTPQIPVAALDPTSLGRSLLGGGTGWHLPLEGDPPPPAPEPEDRLAAFFAHRSAPARRLALALSVIPTPALTPTLLSLVARSHVPEAREPHEAELWVSGLFQVEADASGLSIDGRRTRFRPGLRAALAERVPRTEALRVNWSVRRWLEAHWGQAGAWFAALLDGRGAEALGGDDEEGFAEVARELLARFEQPAEEPVTDRAGRLARLYRDLGERVPPKKDLVRVAHHPDALREAVADLCERHRGKKRVVVDAALDLGLLPSRTVWHRVYAEVPGGVGLPDLGLAGLELREEPGAAESVDPLVVQWAHGTPVQPQHWVQLLRQARTRPVLPIVSTTVTVPGLAIRTDRRTSLVADLLRRRPVHVPIVAVQGRTPTLLADRLQEAGAFVVHEPDLADLVITVGGPLSAPLRWPGHSRQIDRALGLPERIVPGTILHTAPGGIELAYVPAGTFWMGSPDGVGRVDERPRRRVTLTHPYLVGVTPITQAQWRTVARAARLPRTPSQFDGADLPVDSVSWKDCQRWLAALTKQDPGRAVLTADAYALPTEAQWEHACRAGTDTAWSFGDDEGVLAVHAWYAANSKNHTHPVGQLRPNPWGLYDVHGNVWEWCGDRWSSSYEELPTEDPYLPPAPGGRRVIRGGSWGNPAFRCRSAYRNFWNPVERANNRGFRIILPLPPQ